MFFIGEDIRHRYQQESLSGSKMNQAACGRLLRGFHSGSEEDSNMSGWRLVRRALYVFLGAYVVLAGLQVWKGHPYSDAFSFASLWAGIGSALFLTTSLYRVNRKESSCPICRGERISQSGNRR